MNRKYHAMLAVPMVLFLLSLATKSNEPELLSENKTSPKECLDCHEGIWDEATAKVYIHAPFQEKKCIVCHAADTPLNTEEEATDETDPEHKDWTGRSLVPATSHWFEFSTNGKNAAMVLEASYGSTVRLYQEIPLPPLNELENLENAFGEPPLIANVAVIEIKKGVFLTATISWRTDHPTTSKITYWIKGKQESTLTDPILQTDHQETLTELMKDEIYRFKINAEDPVGNIAESGPFEFSTAKTFSNQTADDFLVQCCFAAPLGLESHFYRKDDHYLINITLARPVRLFFKIKEDNNFENDTVGSPDPKTNLPTEIKHIVINEKKIIGLIICKKCHRNLTGHHPVNVFPKKGMVVPSDYPVLDDGRISCITCHTPHASDLRFLVIKDHRQELCIGCHSELAPEKKHP